METNFKLHIVRDKKDRPVSKDSFGWIKITEVRQIYIITFWVTFILFLCSAPLVVMGLCK
ncbi:MAG TPA: hypothetical protein VNY73_03940 [Bacteroidia bacterium]|nr:hypothetical protein [Bacteroidia bacterium]